jgi:type IV pilus assembly protein PilB
MNLIEALVQKNNLSETAAISIEKELKTSEKSVEELLDAKGVKPQAILEAKGEVLNIPTRIIGSQKIPFDVLKHVAEDSVKHYKFAPIAVNDGVLEVGIVNPDNIEALDALNFISARINMPYKLFLITEEDFELVLEKYKGISGEVSEAVDQYTHAEQQELEMQKQKRGKDKKEEADVIKEDAPVTKIVSTILRYAAEGKASDIHVEPLSNNFRVRFRVDGVLNTSLVLPIKVHKAVVARIKVLSNMKLDEKRKPQDGRFSATVGGRRVDFRVSTFPTYYGEKIVMRILDTEKGVWGIDKMGLSDRNVKLLRKALEKPFGIILLSGPTGSGKSTTLYSMLSEVDRDRKNVLSLEDPVEYNIEGIAQSQVVPEIDYTFATGLRSTLRQDPDIIMVGEIRDKETAQLAIQAALTGHLVLSTIHTNNAAGVIPRLIDMGVDPFLIAPTLIIAAAQRLIRTLCEGSGRELPIEGAIKAMIDKEFADLPEEYRKRLDIGPNLYAAEPSSECPNGTRGRTAVMEIMEMDEELEHVILTNPVDEEIHKVTRSKGMLTMKEDAIIKSSHGIVPFAEVNTLGGELLVDEEIKQIDKELTKQKLEEVVSEEDTLETTEEE